LERFVFFTFFAFLDLLALFDFFFPITFFVALDTVAIPFFTTSLEFAPCLEAAYVFLAIGITSATDLPGFALRAFLISSIQALVIYTHYIIISLRDG